MPRMRVMRKGALLGLNHPSFCSVYIHPLRMRLVADSYRRLELDASVGRRSLPDVEIELHELKEVTEEGLGIARLSATGVLPSLDKGLDRVAVKCGVRVMNK